MAHVGRTRCHPPLYSVQPQTTKAAHFQTCQRSWGRLGTAVGNRPPPSPWQQAWRLHGGLGVWRGPAQEPHTAGSAHRHHQAHPPRWKSGKVSSCLASPALMGMPGGWEERNEWDTACFGVQLGLVSTDLLGWRSGGGLKNQLQVWGEFSPPDAVSRQETVSEPSSLLPQELVFFWGAESRLPPAPHLQTCFRDPASSKNHHRDDANGTSRSWVPAKHTSGQALPGGSPQRGSWDKG